MINILTTTQKLTDIDSQAYAILLEQDFSLEQLAQIQAMYEPLADIIKERSFIGARNSSLIVTGSRNNKPCTLILLGLGKLNKKQDLVEIYRRAIGRLVRTVENLSIHTIAFQLPDVRNLGIAAQRAAQETAVILLKALYHFDQFITNKARKKSVSITCSIVADASHLSDVRIGVEQGIIIGEAINRARYWCDMPPSQLTPTIMADQLSDLAQCYNLSSTILDEKQMRELGMGGILAVSRGSSEEARLACLEYKTDKPDAPTVALIGKGITFDSGGLSIKPAKAMETMKDDMAGAAIVMSAMQVIGQLKPPINVVAVAALSENMPGCSAIKPGDVITFYNGKTAEVKNTDAEGRLVLADALAYTIEHYKPAAMIDLATLTGACMAALGPFYAGLFSDHDTFVDKLMVASRHSGDRLWRLPFDEDYKAAIKSDIADMSNIGSAAYMSGATTAGLFLQNFVDDTPWAHIDIAGVAFGVPDMSYLRPGATGFGIRLITDLIMHWHVD